MHYNVCVLSLLTFMMALMTCTLCADIKFFFIFIKKKPQYPRKEIFSFFLKPETLDVIIL